MARGISQGSFQDPPHPSPPPHTPSHPKKSGLMLTTRSLLPFPHEGCLKGQRPGLTCGATESRTGCSCVSAPASSAESPPPGPPWLRELQPSRLHPRQQARQRDVARHQFLTAHHARLVGQELHAPLWAGRQGPEVSSVGALPRHSCCGRREHWLLRATSRPLPLTLWL